MSYSWVLRKKGKSEVDEFEILPLVASGTNTLSLPSQTEHPVTDREEICKIQPQIFNYLRLDRGLWSFNKTCYGLLRSSGTKQHKTVKTWGEWKGSTDLERSLVVQPQPDFAPGHTEGESCEGLAHTLLHRQTIPSLCCWICCWNCVRKIEEISTKWLWPEDPETSEFYPNLTKYFKEIKYRGQHPVKITTYGSFLYGSWTVSHDLSFSLKPSRYEEPLSETWLALPHLSPQYSNPGLRSQILPLMVIKQANIKLSGLRRRKSEWKKRAKDPGASLPGPVASEGNQKELARPPDKEQGCPLYSC